MNLKQLFFMSFLFVACGGNQSYVRCYDSEQCPEYVGLLESSEGQCTFFLVNQITVGTNAHCVPNHLKSAGAACDEDISFHFPETENREAETIRCDELVDVSIDGEGSVYDTDFAFFRMQNSTSRNFLPFSMRKPQKDETLRVIKVDPEPREVGERPEYLGTLRYEHCSFKEFEENRGGDAKVKEALMDMSACQIVSGNSGSPIVSLQSGRAQAVVGIVQASNEHYGSATGTSARAIYLPSDVKYLSASEDVASGSVLSFQPTYHLVDADNKVLYLAPRPQLELEIVSNAAQTEFTLKGEVRYRADVLDADYQEIIDAWGEGYVVKFIDTSYQDLDVRIEIPGESTESIDVELSRAWSWVPFEFEIPECMHATLKVGEKPDVKLWGNVVLESISQEFGPGTVQAEVVWR